MATVECRGATGAGLGRAGKQLSRYLVKLVYLGRGWPRPGNGQPGPPVLRDQRRGTRPDVHGLAIQGSHSFPTTPFIHCMYYTAYVLPLISSFSLSIQTLAALIPSFVSSPSQPLAVCSSRLQPRRRAHTVCHPILITPSTPAPDIGFDASLAEFGPRQAGLQSLILVARTTVRARRLTKH